MPVASQVISPSNVPTPLSQGNDMGTVMGNSSTDLIGFYGATPVAQPGTFSQTTLQTAGSTNALYADSATNGGIAGNNYTFPGIVHALKLLGLIAT